MHLVNDQKVPSQTGRPQVSILDLKRSQHRLVNRADSELRCQEPLGILGGPGFISVVMAGP